MGYEIHFGDHHTNHISFNWCDMKMYSYTVPMDWDEQYASQVLYLIDNCLRVMKADRCLMTDSDDLMKFLKEGMSNDGSVWWGREVNTQKTLDEIRKKTYSVILHDIRKSCIKYPNSIIHIK